MVQKTDVIIRQDMICFENIQPQNSPALCRGRMLLQWTRHIYEHSSWHHMVFLEIKSSLSAPPTRWV